MPGEPEDKISLEQVKAALQRSGYLTESRIDVLLRRRGYHVSPNSSYVDPLTGKAREIDLHALRAIRAGKGNTDFVWPLCLMECVNSPQLIAFFTRPDPVPFLRRELIQIAGLPVRLLSSQHKWIALPEVISMEEYHHYCRGRLATQFCSFSPKKGNPRREWLAQHLPEHFNCFSKLFDAVHESSNEIADCWFDAGDSRHENLNLQFLYPIMVVSGAPIYDVVQRRALGTIDVRETRHIVYRASGVTNQRPVEYLVDVVTEAALPRFFSMLDREMKDTARRLLRRSERVRKSLRGIYDAAAKTGSMQEMRHLTQLLSAKPARN